MTIKDYEAAAARPSGRRLADVTYYVLGWDRDDGAGHHLDDWDHGPFHMATMGVGLRTDYGGEFFATWEQAEWQYGLGLWEAKPKVAAHALDHAVDVTDHALWRPLVGQALGVTLGPRVAGGGEAVDWIGLRAGDAAVTLLPAELDWSEPEAPRKLIGMDAMLVEFVSR